MMIACMMMVVDFSVAIVTVAIALVIAMMVTMRGVIAMAVVVMIADTIVLFSIATAAFLFTVGSTNESKECTDRKQS